MKIRFFMCVFNFFSVLIVAAGIEHITVIGSLCLAGMLLASMYMLLFYIDVVTGYFKEADDT